MSFLLEGLDKVPSALGQFYVQVPQGNFTWFYVQVKLPSNIINLNTGHLG